MPLLLFSSSIFTVRDHFYWYLNEIFVVFLVITLTPGPTYSMYLLLNKPKQLYMLYDKQSLADLDEINRN